jgi:hypothetical protein
LEAAIIFTVVCAVTGEQPPDEGVVYVIIYEPEVLALGEIAPVEEFNNKPEGEEVKVPPPVPVNVTGFTVLSEAQKEVGVDP